MPYYHKLGKLPRKRHTAFYKPDGKSLYREELTSSKGFSGIYSNKYHIYMPTSVRSYQEIEIKQVERWREAPLQHWHFVTEDYKSDGDFLSSRNVFLENDNVEIGTAHPNINTDKFYKNSFCSEYIFIHRGRGNFRSEYGNFRFEEGDQIFIPQSVIYNLEFDTLDNNKILYIESDTPFEMPKHYYNEYGQTEEHAPYQERDFKLPNTLEIHDEKGDFSVLIKAGNKLYEYIHPHHPLDVVGWDGYLYPWAFNIKDYNPKVGRLHLPPPVHLLMHTQSFVLCNFCPRPFDWEDGAIPAPYYHSNIDSAEVLYYVEGDFMSRKGVQEGSVTLHPLGIPHGPQPGKTEASIGKKFTDEYAIMIDTYKPLYVTKIVEKIQDKKYPFSWLED